MTLCTASQDENICVCPLAGKPTFWFPPPVHRTDNCTNAPEVPPNKSANEAVQQPFELLQASPSGRCSASDGTCSSSTEKSEDSQKDQCRPAESDLGCGTSGRTGPCSGAEISRESSEFTTNSDADTCKGPAGKQRFVRGSASKLVLPLHQQNRAAAHR